MTEKKKRDYALSEVPAAASKNALRDAKSARDAYVRAITTGVDPVKSAARSVAAAPGEMAGLAAGGVLSMYTPEMQQMILSKYPGLGAVLSQAQDAGRDLRESYGGYENIKRTVAERPFKAAADASMVAAPAAGLARRAAVNALAKPVALTHTLPHGYVPLTVGGPYSKVGFGTPSSQQMTHGAALPRPAGPGVSDPLLKRPNYRTGKAGEFLTRRNNPPVPQVGHDYIQRYLVRYDNARRLGDDTTAERIADHIYDMSVNSAQMYPSAHEALRAAERYIARTSDLGYQYRRMYRVSESGRVEPAFSGNSSNILRPTGRQPSPLAPTIAPRNALAKPSDLAPEIRSPLAPTLGTRPMFPSMTKAQRDALEEWMSQQ